MNENVMACQFCKLCVDGFPLENGFHIPTQAKGMIPVTRCRATRAFKAGDTVKHHPTGETWLLIRDETEDGRVYPGGWPKTMARASDCTLIEPIEDAPDRLQHIMRD